jgi:hypothetical protein
MCFNIVIFQHHLEILIQSLSKPGLQFINDSFPSSFTSSPCQKKNGDEARRDASAEGFWYDGFFFICLFCMVFDKLNVTYL